MFVHLKMYPTWGQSQRDKLIRINIKYEKYVRNLSKRNKLGVKEKKWSPSFEGEGIMDKKRMLNAKQNVL